MKRTDTRTTALVIGALFAGWLMGASGIASSQAEEVTPAPVVQGEIIKVCINLKSGAIRAASKCDSKTERKTVLGGAGAQGPVGPQGEKGDTGTQGNIGVQGVAGVKGADGKSPDLKLKTISFLASKTCTGVLDGFEYPVVNRIDEYITTRAYARHWTGTLRGCSVSVYAP